MINHQSTRVQYGTGKDLAGQLFDMVGFREAERLTCRPLDDSSVPTSNQKGKVVTVAQETLTKMSQSIHWPGNILYGVINIAVGAHTDARISWNETTVQHSP